MSFENNERRAEKERRRRSYKQGLRKLIESVPVVGSFIVRGLRSQVSDKAFSVEKYWDDRYRSGGSSGDGSYGGFASFKAEVLNAFVAGNNIQTVTEFGCGDGNQLKLANYPQYLGLDVSITAVEMCRRKFQDDSTKRFAVLTGKAIDLNDARADVCLSLDVIYHLVEDQVFNDYMANLFATAKRFVIIYSDNIEADAHYYGVPPGEAPQHVRHREFGRWIRENAPNWKLIQHIPNRYPYQATTRQGSWADFWIYGVE